MCSFTNSPVSLYSNSYLKIDYILLPKTFLTTFDLAGTTPRMGTTEKRKKKKEPTALSIKQTLPAVLNII